MPKALTFLGSSLKDLKQFLRDALHDAGTELRRVQSGLKPKNWKPMPSVGAGVCEVRIKQGSAFRIFYIATLADSVYVIHAFQKKAQKTAKPDLELGQTRFRQLMRDKK
jgi:phage-related protein